jgi:antagonist of KipI
MLEVIEPGLLTTVQDAGRPDWTHLGVPIGGACDGWSLAVANLLDGNEPGVAAIEMTLVGATFAVRSPITIGLAGADLGGIVRESGRRLPPGHTHRLDSGTTIAFGGDTSSGTAREYLALPGGIDVPLVLGSASTALGAGFGGVDGRRLQSGDILRAGASITASAEIEGASSPDAVWPALADDPLVEPAADAPIRILSGPANGLDSIIAGEWRVGAGSDRVGLRLEGPPVATREAPEGRQLLSHGVVFGAIQIPSGGAPIILLADHQTTGGYPTAAVVITADHPRLGQLRPGASVRFAATTIEDARVALARQREALAHGAASLREVAGWDQLWQSAGG